MAVCKELNEKLGAPDAVDSWNDQLEEEAATELDHEIPAWQSEEQLREILDHNFGWVKQRRDRGGMWELTDVIWIDIQRVGEDSIQFIIYF